MFSCLEHRVSSLGSGLTILTSWDPSFPIGDAHLSIGRFMNECPTFRDVLVKPDRVPGEVSPGPDSMGGVNVARQRAPAHLFERGRTSDLVIVAQQNIASTSVEFDLGYGWREHFCPAPPAVYVNLDNLSDER